MKNNSNYEAIFAKQLAIEYYYPKFTREIYNNTLLIAGVGAIGCHLGLCLTKMGFKKITLIDKDIIEASNIPRQILYNVNDIGNSKAETAGKFLKSNNIISEISTHELDITDGRRKFNDLVKEHNFVLCAIDEVPARYFCSYVCHKNNKPMVFGGTFIGDGFSSVSEFQSENGRPCIFCQMFSKMPPEEWINFYQSLSKGEKDAKTLEYENKMKLPSVIPSTYATVAAGSSMMISMMLNYFLGKSVKNRWIFNLLNGYFVKDKVEKNEKCSICS